MNEKGITHKGLFLSFIFQRWVLQILPPYKESRPRDLGRTRKEVGKIYVKLFFSLPSSLIFSMVTPLYFAHFNHFTPCDTSQCIKNLDRILSISQIISNTKILHGSCSSGTLRYFFNWDTWKTSCTSTRWLGSSSWYATSPTHFRVKKGPMKRGTTFLWL